MLDGFVCVKPRFPNLDPKTPRNPEGLFNCLLVFMFGWFCLRVLVFVCVCVDMLFVVFVVFVCLSLFLSVWLCVCSLMCCAFCF